MTTYTLIDSNSGLVWATVQAASAIDAARVADEQIGGRPYRAEYNDCTRYDIRGGAEGYFVYEDDTGVDFTAGDYEAVQKLPLAGVVVVTALAEG